jgi:hypothetical protein
MSENDRHDPDWIETLVDLAKSVGLNGGTRVLSAMTLVRFLCTGHRLSIQPTTRVRSRRARYAPLGPVPGPMHSW